MNAYFIFKEYYGTNIMTMLQFRKSLVRSLLGVPFENVKPSPRERSTSQTKRKLAGHQFEEKQGSDRNVRRCCVHYQKNPPNNQPECFQKTFRYPQRVYDINMNPSRVFEQNG